RMDTVSAPSFTVATSMCPSPLKSAASTLYGTLPTVFVPVKVRLPFPSPNKIATYSGDPPQINTATSVFPSPLKSAVANDLGSVKFVNLRIDEFVELRLKEIELQGVAV